MRAAKKEYRNQAEAEERTPDCALGVPTRRQYVWAELRRGGPKLDLALRGRNAEMRNDGIAGPLCVAQRTSQTAEVHARKQPVGYLWGHDRRGAEICARFALDVLASEHLADTD